MKNKLIAIITILLIVVVSCKNDPKDKVNDSVQTEEMKAKMKKKEVVYQVFTRLFGNTNTNNKVQMRCKN